MHVNKFYDNNIDVTVDTLMYVHSEEVIGWFYILILNTNINVFNPLLIND